MSDTRYLIKEHDTYLVVVDVPKSLRDAAGCPRFKRSLGTGDLGEANSLKYAVIGEFKARIDALKRGADPNAARFRDAADWREALQGSSRAEHEEAGFAFVPYEEILSEIKGISRQLAERDPVQADRFFKAATGEGIALKDQIETWIGECDVSGQTKVQHRATLDRYLKWAGEYVTIQETDRVKAGEYVSYLLKSALARRTVKRHLSSLSSLWRWLKSKGLANDNHWRGHELGKKQRGSAYRKGLDNETLVKLLSGSYSTPKFRRLLHDLIRLALVTGARLDELCALTRTTVTKRDDCYWVQNCLQY